MNEEFKGFAGFLRGIFSEADGSPSASRLCMVFLVAVASACVVRVFWWMTGMDAVRVGLWLSSLPWILGALAGFIGAPYAINKGSNLLSDVLAALKK